ncbi:tyrosine recombinase [Lasius niger]|uniref:Tyrosine recombinase n=1 Tax=Lasius niger TaxID=67767 RepID=A0A0J7KMH8_LASNI|nr:tyrosine recombinase [Lasius niger]
MLKAWEESTIKQYNSALRLRWNLNIKENSDLFDVSIPKVLKFLTIRYKEGANYGTLNSSGSALAIIATEDIRANDLVKKFFKGSLKTKPNKPRYESTWDVDPVLRKLQEWFPLESLSLKQLSQKLALLLALGTAHRLQTLALIKISNITSSDKGLEIRIPDRVKSLGISSKRPILKLPFFKEKPGLCIAKTLRYYLEVT